MGSGITILVQMFDFLTLKTMIAIEFIDLGGAFLADRNNQLIRNKTCNFRTNILFECLKALGPSKSLKIVAHIWSEKCSKNNRDTEFTETHGSGMGTESLSGTAFMFPEIR